MRPIWEEAAAFAESGQSAAAVAPRDTKEAALASGATTDRIHDCRTVPPRLRAGACAVSAP